MRQFPTRQKAHEIKFSSIYASFNNFFTVSPAGVEKVTCGLLCLTVVTQYWILLQLTCLSPQQCEFFAHTSPPPASRTQHKALCDYAVSSKSFKLVYVARNYTYNSMKFARILGFGSGEWMTPSLARVLSTLINHPNYAHYSSFLPQLPRCNEFSSVADFPPSKRCRSISCLCVSSASSNAAWGV